MKYIIINRCKDCPYRTYNICSLLISRHEVDKLEVYDEGELFPKFCPLKDKEIIIKLIDNLSDSSYQIMRIGVQQDNIYAVIASLLDLHKIIRDSTKTLKEVINE